MFFYFLLAFKRGMDQTDHIKSNHEAHIKELCRVCGLRIRTLKDKRLNATTQQCAYHMKTILNLFHTDLSKDEAIQPALVCNPYYSKTRHFERNAVTETSLQSALLCAAKNSHIWCEFDACIPSSQCPVCAHYLSFGKGERKRKAANTPQTI